jgi:uroporphyrinogen decarboxylase
MRPDVAAEVTLQPLRRFDLDAAIIFADILLPLEPMGIGFHFTPEDGPVIEKPVRTAADLEGVRTIDAAADLPYVMDALRLVRRELDGRVPLIGFSGAPFTLASYIVEGGHSRNYTHVKKLMYKDPATFERLMGLISDVVVDYLLAQIAAGAQVVQLFDSWVGWLGPYDYEHLVLAHVRRVVEQVKGRGAPVIYFGNGASGMLHHVATVPSDVIGVDWRIDIDRAWQQLGEVAVQGNLDPITLLGPPAAIEERVADIIARVGGRPGHIFNLGHGLVPQTPPDNVNYVIDAVHRLIAAPV